MDETLRWDGPISWFPFRYPTRDLTVGGTVIARGTPVLAGYTAAGRDGAAHGPDADRFDLTRPTAARHLSFGHGAHYCVGAPLARLEATTALEQLFTRFPDLDLATPEDELPRQRSFIGNSVQALPVRPYPRRDRAAAPGRQPETVEQAVHAAQGQPVRGDTDRQVPGRHRERIAQDAQPAGAAGPPADAVGAGVAGGGVGGESGGGSGGRGCR